MGTLEAFSGTTFPRPEAFGYHPDSEGTIWFRCEVSLWIPTFSPVTHLHLPTSESQYKYHFRKWGWKKNIPAAKKNAIIGRGQTRAALGKSTVATFKGKQVDPKKLRRQAKEEARKGFALKPTSDSAENQQASLFGSVLPFGNRM